MASGARRSHEEEALCALCLLCALCALCARYRQLNAPHPGATRRRSPLKKKSGGVIIQAALNWTARTLSPGVS